MNIECVKEVKSYLYPMTTSFGMTHAYSLRCKIHGELLMEEETNFNTAFVIEKRFHDAWHRHVADMLIAKKTALALDPPEPFEYEGVLFKPPSYDEMDHIQAMAAQKAQAYHAAHPEPIALTTPTVSCEKLLVERVGDDAQGTHYMILLCKRHGQLAEEVIYPANIWEMQRRMDQIFQQHVNNPEPQPQPRTKPEPFDPASRFGRVAKRKFG